MANSRSPKQRVVFESEEPVTALGFAEDAKRTVLHIVTTNRIMTYVTAGKSQGSPPRLLDALGCALGCVAFRENSEMVVGRDDAVYLYGGESKGAVYAFEGTFLLGYKLRSREEISGIIIQGLHCCNITSHDRIKGHQK
jgi:hypothetical protein